MNVFLVDPWMPAWPEDVWLAGSRALLSWWLGDFCFPGCFLSLPETGAEELQLLGLIQSWRSPSAEML